MSEKRRQKIVLCFGALLFCGQQAQAALACGILDRAPFNRTTNTGGHPVVSYTWRVGERAIPMRGARFVSKGLPLTFTLNTRGQSAGLTLVLREFRTGNSGGVAYLVSVNGRRIAFRNEKFNEAGPATAFVDVPPVLARTGKLTVRLANVSAAPVQISEVLLLANLETFAKSQGMVQPLTLYLTGKLDPAQITRWRSQWTDRPDVRLGWCDPQFAYAQWTPERQKSELEKIIAFGRQNNLPVELFPVSWWGGTPSGPDGLGGRWNDVTYQQVTYSPRLGLYGLSVPNRWSSTPWLTMGSPRLNAFKADGLRAFGALLREAYARNPTDFPIRSLVLDNEPTFWGFGNPGGSPFSAWDTPDAVADFNPALTAMAQRRGVTLDPRRGLNAAQTQFLGGALTAYFRLTHDALYKGMGDMPLAEHVYTHSFENRRNGIFSSVVAGAEAGVIRAARLGLEGDIGVNGDFDQYREVGVPAAINVEFGGRTDSGPTVQAAYAAGCDHVTLFNAADAAVGSAKESLDAGWQEFTPQPWRPALLTQSPQSLLASAVSHDSFDAADGKLVGAKLGQDNRLLLHFTSRRLMGKPQFGPLALRYSARAFVFQHSDPGGFLAVRAGATLAGLHEVGRLFNSGGSERAIDLTAVAGNAGDLWVEFDLHPLGLTDWVNVFRVSLEKPWPCEALNAPNRSYRADRLRAEAGLVGWRADADWSLRLAAQVPPARLTPQDRADIHGARALFASGSYAKANAEARRVVRQHTPAALPPPRGWAMPALDRDETGELTRAGDGTVTLDPYSPGFCGRSVSVATGAEIAIVENGERRDRAALSDLASGDDVQVQVRGGVATRIEAQRADADARIVGLTPSTPFALPTVTLEGQPARAVAGGVTGRDGKPWVYQVGVLPLAVGDRVRARWNPRTGRLRELRFLAPSDSVRKPSG